MNTIKNRHELTKLLGARLAEQGVYISTQRRSRIEATTQDGSVIGFEDVWLG